MGVRAWYKLEKHKANQNRFEAKNREAERDLADFLILCCSDYGWWYLRCQILHHTANFLAHTSGNACPPDVSQKVSGDPQQELVVFCRSHGETPWRWVQEPP